MKNTWLIMLAFAVPVASSGQTQEPAPVIAEAAQQLAVRSADIEWQACPGGLPPGCEIAVLEGDPNMPELFTVRFRLSGEFLMPQHTHPKHERVTVLSGRTAVAFGVGASRGDAKEFGPGDYYVNPPGAIHTVWIDEPSVLQITGFGPWEANFVE